MEMVAERGGCVERNIKCGGQDDRRASNERSWKEE